MLSHSDFPDYAAILRGSGKPLDRKAVPFEGDPQESVAKMFAEIDYFGGLPGFADLPDPVNPQDYPEEEFHFLVASGLGYTLAGAKVYANHWPGDWSQYANNATRWAKTYLNSRDYKFFESLVERLIAE